MTALRCDQARERMILEGLDDARLLRHACECPRCAMDMATQALARRALAAALLVPEVPDGLVPRLRSAATARGGLEAGAPARARGATGPAGERSPGPAPPPRSRSPRRRRASPRPAIAPDTAGREELGHVTVPTGYLAVITAVRQAEEARLEVEDAGGWSGVPRRRRAALQERVAIGRGAFRRLLETHAELVAVIADEFLRRGLTSERVRHAAEDALLDAAREYLPEQMQPFDAHAAQRMRQRLMRELRGTP